MAVEMRVLLYKTAASTPEIAEGLLADVQRFAGGQDAADDRTILALPGRG